MEEMDMQFPITQESSRWDSPNGLNNKWLTGHNYTKTDTDINKQMLQELKDIETTTTKYTGPPHDDITKGSVTSTT